MAKRMKLRTYDGAVALITGGASGIGRGIGEELARRGAEVVLADVQLAMAEEAAAGIVKAGGRATAARLDVTDDAATEALFEETTKRTGRIDYVFANAGTGTLGEVHLLEKRDWDLMLNVNIHGVVNTVRAAYPRMIAQGFGHIVNVASLAGLVPAPFVGVYAMTKHAVVGLSKTMRVEAARHGVRVTALCPGVIRTPILTGGAQGRTVYSGLVGDRILDWWKRFGPITELGPFVKDTLDAVARNTGIIVLPKRNLALLTLLHVLPASVSEAITTKIYEDTLRDFPEIARGA